MTQQTDNVLVSREWIEAMIKYLEDATWVDIEGANAILDMPNYIESERDVEVVCQIAWDKLCDEENYGEYKWEEAKSYDDLDAWYKMTQALINAMAYRKDI